MRSAKFSGSFYPEGKEALTEAVEACFAHPLGPGLPGKASSRRTICAAVSPHAGYIYSGMAAAHVYKAIAEEPKPRTYVIIGPDHVGMPYEATLCGEPFETPLGVCRIDEEACERLSEFIPNVPSAHGMEHSIEVQIPFLQYIDPDARIVPVMIGRQTPAVSEAVGAAIRMCCTDFIAIASSDLTHYEPKRSARRKDGIILRDIEAMDMPKMFEDAAVHGITACGRGPIAAALAAAAPERGEVLARYDSDDAVGMDPGRVVGYGAAVFRRAEPA